MRKLIYAAMISILAFNTIGCAQTKNEVVVEEKATCDELLEHGNNLFKQKKYDKALKQYLKALEEDPSRRDVYSSLYKTYTVLGEEEKAREINESAQETLSENEYQAYVNSTGQASQNNTDDKSDLEFAKYVEKISTYVGTEIDYNDYFEGKSAKKFTISFDDHNVDLNTPGEYKLVVTLKGNKGKKITKEALIIVEESEYEFVPGMYMSLTRVEIKSEANPFAESVGSFAEDIQVVVDQVVRTDDGSYWALLSTGYACIQDQQESYMEFTRNRVPVAADFDNDNYTFIDTVCPAVSGLGGMKSEGTFVGSVNRTMSCDDVFIVY